MSELTQALSKCRICSVPTGYSYYGVRSCEACKIFFRRNISKGLARLTCPYGGQCEINVNNRHICSACRLKKCLDVGMSPDLIRGPRGRTTTQSQQIRPLNLLDKDQSILTNEQWNLLSNLIHSYDETSALPIAKNFIQELDSKPAKIRFKITVEQVMELSNLFYQRTEPFILSNQDFHSLPIDDRSIVLHGAIDSVSCLGGGFLLRQSGLIENAAFCQGLELTFGSIPFNFTKTIVSLLDENDDLVKLALALLAFSTSNCTIFNENTSTSFVKDYRSVLRIQDIYAEAIWKYLIYRYSFSHAVMRFHRLVQCLILTLTIKTHLQAVKNHRDAIDSLIEKIEEHQQMNINDR